ncbi:MAG: SAM-dependent chlorinase/fluorinase [Thermogutta sp.]|nr:SAM-dependent chlorinase/fluorinase [Thermogutta sp.]
MKIITLLTDFGSKSHYAAVMKGVMLSLNPAAQLVDITHEVPPQDVFRGAWLLGEAAPYFPAGTIHLAVVDPGVGTDRACTAARLGDQFFVAPDNGLLGIVARRLPLLEAVRLEQPNYRRAVVSNTFHGRDIMAPAAAHLSLGVTLRELGPRIEALRPLPFPQVERGDDYIEGCVIWVDDFGNLVTNIARKALPEPAAGRAVVTCGDCPLCDWVNTYAERPAGTRVVLFGSSDYLEIAVVQGNAAAELGAGPGTPVRVQW